MPQTSVELDETGAANVFGCVVVLRCIRIVGPYQEPTSDWGQWRKDHPEAPRRSAAAEAARKAEKMRKLEDMLGMHALGLKLVREHWFLRYCRWCFCFRVFFASTGHF
jgi:hypothetical protein